MSAFGPELLFALMIQGHAAGHEYDGGVIITASHLPYNRNGFKFFTKDGGFDKKDITQLLESAAKAHAAEHAPQMSTNERYLDASYVLSKALQVDGSRVENVSPSLHTTLRRQRSYIYPFCRGGKFMEELSSSWCA